MAVALESGWSKPSAILFASDSPTNEKAFRLALAQASEFVANLIILYVHDSLDSAASGAPAIFGHDVATAQNHRLKVLAQRAISMGIHCTIVVRAGLVAEQILAYLHEQKIDRVIMGAQSPGSVGKLLVGSVAEALLRTANVPVCIVGPHVVESTYLNPVSRKILCDVSKQEASNVVANFGAELAAKYNASLILQQIIPAQERATILSDLTIDQIEAELPTLVPAKLQRKVRVQTRVAIGDPTDELLCQGRAQQANLIVLGAHGASHFAAITRAGIVYKVLAFAHCPVITMSPILLSECGAKENKLHPSEVNFIAGVI
jgi:nucleotide-binding universal stress UspA family protein